MLRDLLDLVLPTWCPGCDLPGTDLCGACAEGLSATPVARTLPGLRVEAAGLYEGAARACLVAHKEQGRRSLARPLGAALAVAVTALELPGPLRLVPVPSSAAAVRARGHDHARRLAVEAARSLSTCGLPAVAVVALRPVRRTADQVGLDAAARARNLGGALACTRRLPGDVVVVDDVVTSGATLGEAARALRAGGARVVGAAVVAAVSGPAPRRVPGGRGARAAPGPGPPVRVRALSRSGQAV